LITIKYKNNITKGGWGQIECPVSISGVDLKQRLSLVCDIPVSSMKLLYKGKFLKDEQNLKEQNVVDKASILIQQGKTEEKSQIQLKFQKHENAERVIKAAATVAERNKDTDESNYRFEVQNQDGTKVKMDPEDNKYIVMAMSLHDKGIKMIEKSEFDISLKYLLESDSAFTKLKDQNLLEQIDNYAKLCIDITWCLLKADKLDEILSNAWRLEKAHQILKKAYGENNERLIQVRGGCCPELIIYVRLFLLQAIVSFQIKDVRKSRIFINLAEQKLMQMTITENDIIDLLHMGFSLRECRVGLRACNKSTQDAIQWLLMRRENAEKKKRERQAKNRIRKYGKTQSGDKINIELLIVFISQGFDEEMVAEALKQSNNDQDRSYHLLTNEIELLRMAVNNSKPPYIPNEEDILEIMTMGFSRAQAVGTLKLTRGDLSSAADKLLTGEGREDNEIPLPPVILPEQPLPELPQETEEERAQKEKENQLLREAESELIDDHEEDPLLAYDIDLTDESQFISHYKTLISTSWN